MCAIAGFQGSGSVSVLHRMTGSMAHRGPDGDGHWVDERRMVYFGHRRLSILDLENGAQPMASSCGRFVITFNGEIYNHGELKKELQKAGRVFTTSHSDTEVLLNAYAEWGADMLNRLNGMWAFAIYDRKNEEIFLARDRFGKKPLYYAQSTDSFVFGSELTSLTFHPAVSGNISNLGLSKFFGYGYIPAPHTALEDVKKLPAGHWMKFSCVSRELEVKRYWRYRIETCPDLERADDNELAEELARRLRESIARRMVADVPVGVFLSGGIDSSAVAALAMQGQQSIDTFSIGFEEQSFDESRYASLVADHLGTNHYSKKLQGSRVAGLSESVLNRLDEPLGDSSLVATSMLCEFASEKVKVALGGDGSDELLCGYDPFKALKPAKAYQTAVPGKLHDGILALLSKLPVSHRNMSLDFRLKRALRGMGYQPGIWAPVWMSSMSELDLREFTGHSVPMEETFSEAIEAWDSCESEFYEDRLSQFFVDLYLQDDILTKVDRASMLFGLEVRAPFLDIDVVDFCRKLPVKQKFHRGVGKVILRRAIRDFLPAEILNRPKKGFGIPVGKWFQSETLSPGDARWGSPGKAKQLHHHHLESRSDERAFLWNLMVMNQWAGNAVLTGDQTRGEKVGETVAD